MNLHKTSFLLKTVEHWSQGSELPHQGKIPVSAAREVAGLRKGWGRGFASTGAGEDRREESSGRDEMAGWGEDNDTVFPCKGPVS